MDLIAIYLWNSSPVMQPTDQISTAFEYVLLFSKISGARYLFFL